MGYLNKNTKSLADNMDFLANSLKGAFAFAGLQQFTKLSDEMQNLTNRLKLTVGAGETVEQNFDRIVGVANRTKQSIAAVGDTYNRFAVTLESVHANSSEVAALTETLINSFRVSGSSASETANAMVQLSQAFSIGVLRGQDLRSVLSQNVTVAKYLKQEYGNDLFKKAEQGMIKTSDVVRILIKHQKELFDQAKNLSPTFEQTLTTAMNNVSVKIGELNKQYDLSGKFAAAMEFAVSHLTEIMLLSSVFVIPKLIEAIQGIAIASYAVIKTPLGAALAALAVAGILVYENFDRLTILMDKFIIKVTELSIAINEKLYPILGKMFGLVFGKDAGKTFTDDLLKGLDKDKEKIKVFQKEIEDIQKKQADINKKKKEEDPFKALKDLQAKLKAGDVDTKVKKIKEILGELNNEFLTGAINVDEYNRKLINFELYKLNREFKEGKFDIFTYNQRLKELNIQDFNRQVKNGYLNFQQFRDAVEKANIQELTAKFEAGKISLYEYNKELIKLSDKFQPGSALYVGTQDYLNSIGTLSENVAKAITGVFTKLEDSLLEFTKTGEFNFAKFTSAILEDLQRIIIRMSIIKPLANAILGIYSPGGRSDAGATDLNGGAYAADVQQAANGMGFYNNVRKFATGGIVSRPTPFTYNGGRRGLMGEAGSEAILPLHRGSNGKLGVAAAGGGTVVNIYNQSGADVTQTERTGPNGEKAIDILIHNKVKEGLSTGKYDSAMKGAYGVNRKGS